jgi:hypothetical protein
MLPAYLRLIFSAPGGGTWAAPVGVGEGLAAGEGLGAGAGAGLAVGDGAGDGVADLEHLKIPVINTIISKILRPMYHNRLDLSTLNLLPE